MATTRDYRLTTIERIQSKPLYGLALLEEAAGLIASGEPNVARLILRDVANATLGFEGLAKHTGKNSKSLHRMLSSDGNPTMDNVALIFKALRKDLEAKSKTSAKAA